MTLILDAGGANAKRGTKTILADRACRVRRCHTVRRFTEFAQREE
jgi:hypothetical protein